MFLKEKAHVESKDGRRDYTTRIIAMSHCDTDKDVITLRKCD